MEKPVVVIGGGLAGLTAQQRSRVTVTGSHCTRSLPVSGGRAGTLRQKGFSLNFGQAETIAGKVDTPDSSYFVAAGEKLPFTLARSGIRKLLTHQPIWTPTTDPGCESKRGGRDSAWCRSPREPPPLKLGFTRATSSLPSMGDRQVRFANVA